jgi:hypothetical protein
MCFIVPLVGNSKGCNHTLGRREVVCKKRCGKYQTSHARPGDSACKRCTNKENGRKDLNSPRERGSETYKRELTGHFKDKRLGWLKRGAE